MQTHTSMKASGTSTLLLASIVSSLVFLLLGFVVTTSRVGAKQVRVNVKDLPAQGLSIILSSDPSFQKEMSKSLGIEAIHAIAPS